MEFNQSKQETIEEASIYQQELFNYLRNLGITALQSEMQEIERIVLSMQEQDKNKYSEEEVLFLLFDFCKEEKPEFKTNPVCVSNWFEKFKKK
jgi:hypothetical protein